MGTRIAFLVLLNLVAVFAEFPSQLTRCKKDDVAFNDCILKSAQDGFLYILQGDENVGLHSFSPYLYPSKRHLGIFLFKFDVSDVAVTYINTSTVEEFTWDVKNRKVHIRCKFDKIRWDFDLETSGLFIGNSLNGAGRSSKTYTNGWWSYDMQYETTKVNGVLYPKIRNAKSAYDFENSELTFSHLDDRVTNLVNKNARQFINIIHKQVDLFITDALSPVFEAIFKITPLDQLFL